MIAFATVRTHRQAVSSVRTRGFVAPGNPGRTGALRAIPSTPAGPAVTSFANDENREAGQAQEDWSVDRFASALAKQARRATDVFYHTDSEFEYEYQPVFWSTHG